MSTPESPPVLNDGSVQPDSSGDDFPFYNGRPVWISGRQWLFVMLLVVVGFLVVVAPVSFFRGHLTQFIPAVLFFVIPLAGLAIVAPRHWTAIFRKVGLRDVFWMVAFALLNIVVTLSIGAVVKSMVGANANPAVAQLADKSGRDQVLFFLKTIPHLFGEEVLSILPFLALMYLFSARLKFSRTWSIVLAWLLSAVWFGAVHLPTYGWNVIQCLVIIGSARLVLTMAYMKTKNIWVSTGAHILNDWILFGGTIILSRLTTGS